MNTLRRALVLAALATVVPLAADTYPRQAGVDVQHYAFRLDLADESDQITGEATVELLVLAEGLGEVVLDLVGPAPAAPERGMTVTEVHEGASRLPFQHVGGRLKIALATPGRAGERRTLVVRYRGIPATGLVIAPNKHGDRTFFSDNWPDKARHWLPVVDHPYDKATSEMEVTAPAHYQVVSNGRLVEETDLGSGRRRTRWRQAVPIASWLYAVGAARFAVEHRSEWRGRSIETWVFAQDRDAGFRVFSEPTRAALDFFEDRIGPYPYERLAHVQANGVKGGMEVATSIFYGADSVTDPPTPRWRNVMVHEIAHQWWGNSVTESDWDDVWLSEGFATYFTHLFVEHARGRDAFVAGLRADRDTIRDFDRKHPDYRVVHDQLADMRQVLSGPGTYRKGAWTLHMLRGVVGDTAFWQGIREHYRRHRDGHATTADFRRVMEESSGLELSWFFDQWLTRGGMLNVRARWRHDPAAGVLRLQLEQLQAGAPYRMPIEVSLALEGAAEPRVERIDLRERSQLFTLAISGRPTAVALDPRDRVLMDADVAEEAARP